MAHFEPLPASTARDQIRAYFSTAIAAIEAAYDANDPSATHAAGETLRAALNSHSALETVTALGSGAIATGYVAQTVQAACDLLCESLAENRTSDHADVTGAYQMLRGALARSLRAVS